MTPIRQENRSCPLLRFSINIYGTSRFITLHPLRLHFYFLKIQKQRKTWERFWDEKMSRSSSGTKAPAWRQTSEHGNSGPRQSTKKCLVSLLQLLPHPTPRLLFGFLIFLQFECEEQQSTAQEQSMSGCCRSVTGNARNSVPKSPGTSALWHSLLTHLG